jgi:CHASE3 domain sensor protein
MSATTTFPAGLALQRFDVFLSHNRRDGAVVERIARRLKRAGLEPWLDKWSLTPGGEWQRELGAGLDASVACAVFVGPHELGAWELQELAVALDRAARQQGFRVFPVLLPGVGEPFDPNRLPHFLRARTWVDFRRGCDDERALQDLINAVKGVPFGPDVPVAPRVEVVPYRGLRVFGEQDAPFFFGRDREVQRLHEKLKSSRFVAVLGPSGSGKSSLVQAGLVPELHARARARGEQWRICVLRPGAAPLTALAAQLAKLLPGRAMQATLDALARDARTLHLSVELALADGRASERVVVVVDQLEEVFTLCSDETQRRQLFATLLDATSAPGGRTVVIVTLRTDFYARCAAYPELAQLIGAQQMLVGPMDAEGLCQAIEEPAHQVGLELEKGLSDTILADVGAEPGGLPLLEHALLELWERRRGTMLTLEGYLEAGGVHGALAQRADQVYDELSAEQRQVARRALLRLTQPGEGTEDTRRRAPRNELVRAGGDDNFEQVLGRLVDARLLTTGRDETGKEIVDVSHEALIRGWPRLREWIDADRAGLVTHRRLTGAAYEWDALNREPAALYRGARLGAAREWASEHDDDLSGLERDFLAASHASEHSEAEIAIHRTHRLLGLATGLAMLTVIVAALAVWAIAQRNDLQRQRSVAQHQAAQATASATENSLITIENGLRGYVASGQVRLLVPVRDALRRYPGQQRTLARRISDNAGQRQIMVDLGKMINDYVRLRAVPVIDLAGKSSARARRLLLKNDRNPSNSDPRLEPIQREFARFDDRERAIIADRLQAAEQRSGPPITFGVAGLAFVLAVAVGFTMHLRRSAVTVALATPPGN